MNTSFNCTQSSGSLGELKKEAKKMSKDPVRFLENYANKGTFTNAASLCSALDDMASKLAKSGENAYLSKMSKLKSAQINSQKRAFLINMSSVQNSTQEMADMRETESIHNNVDQYIETIIQTDVTDIVTWIAEFEPFEGTKLPYGVPPGLKVPSDPEEYEHLNHKIKQFVEASVDEFYLLDGQYANKVDEIQKLWTQVTQQLRTTWEHSATALLYYVFLSINQSPLKRTTGFLLNEVTTRLFPSCTPEEIIDQKYRLKTKRCLEERLEAVHRDWIRDKMDLCNKINTAWGEMKKKREAHLTRSAEARKQHDLCRYWSQYLDKLRQERAVKVQNLAALELPMERLRIERQRAKEESDKRHRESMKLKITEFREKQRLRQSMESVQKMMVDDSKRIHLQKRQVYNKQRVQYRQEELEKKQINLAEEKEKRKAEQQRLEQILEDSKTKVELDYDPNNIHSHTHASLIRYYETTDKGSEDDIKMIKFFKERYHFSNETVWADRRIRLETRLRDAGLMDSVYAHQVLTAMQPRDKPHLRSQVAFKDDITK